MILGLALCWLIPLTAALRWRGQPRGLALAFSGGFLFALSNVWILPLLLTIGLVFGGRAVPIQAAFFVMACVMLVYAADVALDRVTTVASTARWLRFQWLGIAWLPAAYYNFSLSVLAATNYRIQRRRWIA